MIIPCRQCWMWNTTLKATKIPLLPTGILRRREYGDKVLQWLTTVEKELKRKPVIYTNHYIGKTYLNRSEFKNYPLYIAYPVTVLHLDQYKPEIPPAWDNYAFWQYTTKNDEIPGVITDNVDLDLFNGSLDDLKDFVKETNLK